MFSLRPNVIDSPEEHNEVDMKADFDAVSQEQTIYGGQ